MLQAPGCNGSQSPGGSYRQLRIRCAAVGQHCILLLSHFSANPPLTRFRHLLPATMALSAARNSLRALTPQLRPAALATRSFATGDKLEQDARTSKPQQVGLQLQQVAAHSPLAARAAAGT